MKMSEDCDSLRTFLFMFVFFKSVANINQNLAAAAARVSVAYQYEMTTAFVTLRAFILLVWYNNRFFGQAFSRKKGLRVEGRALAADRSQRNTPNAKRSA